MNENVTGLPPMRLCILVGRNRAIPHRIEGHVDPIIGRASPASMGTK
jgi:hypothetical protein